LSVSSTFAPRAALLRASAAALLVIPFVLAFYGGGYLPEPRAWAGLAASVTLIAGVLLRPLPRGRAALLTLGGLLLFAAWTLLSTVWAPVAGDAYHAGELDFLYVAATVAAAQLLRGRSALRALEPALAAGTLVVIGYGLSERFLPGLLHFARSETAGGRLEQPLTYWNAMGELAAIGFVLCSRMAGDFTRRAAARALAAAAAVPLGLGIYLTFSRGAIYACLAGLLLLLVLVRRREQLQAMGVAVAGAVLASVAAAPFKGVTSLLGPLHRRETQGAITLALLVLITVLAAAAMWALARDGRTAPLALPRRSAAIALVLIVAGLGVAIVVGAKETSHATTLGGGAGRLTTLRSDRYAYWNVAFKAFTAEPVHGVGAGGWAVWWLRYRKISGFAKDAHSLPLQTLAELGLVGLALLAVFLAGIAVSARVAHRLDPQLSAGMIAGVLVYYVHAPLDWDWELPALTLVAMVLTGALVALAARPRREAVAEAAPAPLTAVEA